MEARQNNAATEARDVLTKYLELFQQSSIDFKYHLAPNSVIDWYGRTVRGANKIHDYLRHEVNNQFEHTEFLDAEVCGPIETKTSHMRTKVISTKPIDHVHPINRVPDMVPLKSYADSDVEDNEQPTTISSSANLFGAGAYIHTPEKCNTSTLEIGNLTPPSSAVKEHDRKSEDEEIDNNETMMRRHRLKRTHSGNFSYLKRLPTAPSTSKRNKNIEGGVRTLLDDSSSEEDELEVMEALYTPLRYLEVKGVMRLRNNNVMAKQRSALWRDRSELETRVRISYRRKLEDNQLQFALIIYESLNGSIVATTPTRRNLMSQFALTADEAQTNETQTQHMEEEHIEETVIEPIAGGQLPSDATTTLLNDEDPLQGGHTSLEDLSVANLRTPTKFTHTPPATPKRKPRSLMGTASGMKRLNNSPQAPPAPKRSAARSLRL
ncbi:uncharacterized protein LOC101901046 [Musca domestica]|uniref:Uncharacterized protein LOC101901046 n=1 Tax=Musca domestica TaxID=7370 RepID=A0ABM3VIN8_MUSDO|nr:uncharacterized protein LOC101901046 [Musca domestica]XP_058985647.1 uncharacterized protein LOC101901046 [Musca domestica]XP_058985648.1 uncharacterized protein LOC101901046 [Musca domestica]